MLPTILTKISPTVKARYENDPIADIMDAERRCAAVLEYVEVKRLPNECIGCSEDCYECDYALSRWVLTAESIIELQRLIDEKKRERERNRAYGKGKG